jgi:hypothetical protein
VAGYDYYLLEKEELYSRESAEVRTGKILPPDINLDVLLGRRKKYQSFPAW